MITLVNESDLPHKRPLLASLEAALASIQRDSCHSAVGQLGAFQNKVRAQVTDANLALALVQSAGQVIAALDCDGSPPVACRGWSLRRSADSCMHLEFSGDTGAAYILEASTNLVDWEALCVVRPDADGHCQFADPDAPNHQSRFYRVGELK